MEVFHTELGEQACRLQQLVLAAAASSFFIHRSDGFETQRAAGQHEVNKS